MNPRLYIAGHALQGIRAACSYTEHDDGDAAGRLVISSISSPAAAAIAVADADALLAELHKTSPAAAASPSVPPAETAARGQGGR